MKQFDNESIEQFDDDEVICEVCGACVCCTRRAKRKPLFDDDEVIGEEKLSKPRVVAIGIVTTLLCWFALEMEGTTEGRLLAYFWTACAWYALVDAIANPYRYE